MDIIVLHILSTLEGGVCIPLMKLGVLLFLTKYNIRSPIVVSCTCTRKFCTRSWYTHQEQQSGGCVRGEEH